MRLERFAVSGFKSIREEVVLEPLHDINVLHGPNNVGKSNVLAAIDLLFRALSDRTNQPWPTDWVSGALASPFGNVFNALHPMMPGDLRAVVSLTEGEAAAVAVLAADQVRGAEIHVVLERSAGNVRFKADRLRPLPSSRTDDAVGLSADYLKKLSGLLCSGELMGQQLGGTGFELISTHRTGSEGEGLVAQDLRHRLFAAHFSKDPVIRRRWDALLEAVSVLQPELGPGSLIPTFEDDKGDVSFQLEEGPILPLSALGTGVQQAINLLARLLLSRSPIVGIEEPELNLSYDLQRRLLEALRRMVGSPERGPTQLFITSHSPAFDCADTFFEVDMRDRATVVTLMKTERAIEKTFGPVLTEADLRVRFDGDLEPAGWVTREGLVELPESVREGMGLTHGRKVYFIRRDDGPFEMLTAEDLERLWGQEP